MKPGRSRRRPAIAALLLAVAVPAIPAAAPEAGRHAEELAQIRQRIDALQRDLRILDDQRQALRQGLREVEGRIAAISGHLHLLRGQRTHQEQRINALEQEEAALERRIDASREALARQIRAAYQMGRQQRIKLLLNQEDAARVSRMLVYYDLLDRARVARLHELQGEQARLERVVQEIRRRTDRLHDLERLQQQEQARLQGQETERARVLAQLERDRADKGDELERLRQNARRLQRLVDGIGRALAEWPLEPEEERPFPQLLGQLPWPVKGTLAIRYGTMRKMGKLRWEGVFIAAPEGREVHAVARGRVVFADWLRGYGLLLILDHGDGYLTLYGHNQSLFKEVGDWVAPGEVIGLTGESGGHHRSGLYFGIRRQGRPVDPQRWCRRAKGHRVGGHYPNPPDPVRDHREMHV